MTLVNLIITAGVLGSAWYIMRADVRSGGKILKQNLKTIRSWMDEAQQSSAAKEAKQEVKQIMQNASKHEADAAAPPAASKLSSRDPPAGLQ